MTSPSSLVPRPSSILISGPTGFVGRRVVAAARAAGWRVVALVRPGNARGVDDGWDGVVEADLEREAPVVLPAGIDSVIHLAGRAHALAERPAEAGDYAGINIDGTRRLLAGAAAAGVRAFVFVSTIKVFGDAQQRGDRALTEDDPPEPDTPYGGSKLAAERLVLGDLRIPHRVVLRPALVYGPGVKGNLARMAEAVRRGRFPALPDTGNRRSLVHVDDLAAALLLAATAPAAAGRVYHVTDGEAYSTRRIHRALCAAAGRRPPRWTLPLGLLRGLARVGDALGAVRGRRFFFDSPALRRLTESAWFDGARLQRELGWQPRRTLEGDEF